MKLRDKDFDDLEIEDLETVKKRVAGKKSKSRRRSTSEGFNIPSVVIPVIVILLLIIILFSLSIGNHSFPGLNNIEVNADISEAFGGLQGNEAGIVLNDTYITDTKAFNENGKVYLQDLDINGEMVSGDKIFKEIIEIIKKTNPNVKIHCNILGPDGADSDDKEKLHSKAFVDNDEALIDNILNLLKSYNFEGIFFDYEYPYSKQSIEDYSDFLVKLDSKLGDYILGAAFSQWSSNISKDAIKVLDRVEIMAYDNMGEYSAHAEFATVGGALAIKDFEKHGYDLSKCDLGLPFYGRTHGGDEAWPSYAQVVGDLDNNPFKNKIAKSYMNGVTDGSIVTSFNGVQMIKDKTAFANDYGLGGVMVWHYTCDVPYESDMSLFKAIQTGLKTRS